MSEPLRILEINDFTVYAYGGLHEVERIMPRPFRFDIGIELRSISDPTDLSQSVDYESVCREVSQEMLQPFELIEDAAQRVFDRLMAQIACRSLTVKLTKQYVPIKGLSSTSITLSSDSL
ncbi:MAG: dihydroneopterin aldolase [Flavobacteriales bacterium]|nr:dihydroneopterin aldolase [Bacteroidota bacterium]MCB9241800.1 dihydroneopterin aldolase [Flavobacteriales bacterium]